MRHRRAHRRDERRRRRTQVRRRYPPGRAGRAGGGQPGHLRPDVRPLHLGEAADPGPAGAGQEALGGQFLAAPVPHGPDGPRRAAARPARHRARARLTSRGHRDHNLTVSTNSLLSSTTNGRADEPVAAVREFNRFYTNVLGLLREGLLDTPYSLTEARVIFELARQDLADAGALRRSLDIDAGYLSRILARFAAAALLRRARTGLTPGRCPARWPPPPPP